MAWISYTVLTTNDMITLADDFRGIGHLVDICNEHDVGIGITMAQDRLTVYTEEADQKTLESIQEAICKVVPVYVDIEEGRS